MEQSNAGSTGRECAAEEPGHTVPQEAGGAAGSGVGILVAGSRERERADDRRAVACCLLVLSLVAGSIGYRVHRELVPEWYHRTFNPVIVSKETVYPAAYVSVPRPESGRFVAIIRRADRPNWNTEVFCADQDIPSYGIRPGTVTVVEDADDDSMRIVEVVEYRKNGDPFRFSYIIHVNPHGRAASPPAAPGIWSQVQRADLPPPVASWSL
jgi:hypothetical protein